MRGLITDRARDNVLRRNELSAKGFASMTAEEQKEWLGSPLDETGVNLLPPGPYYSSAVDLVYSNDSIVATTSAEGIYLYAISIIGDAANYEGKTFTLSADYIGTADGGTPQLALYWHDDSGFEFAGASLTEAGSVTFTVTENTGGRASLALYVYVTTDATVSAGAAARFRGVMLENGDVRRDFSPYTEVLPTAVTKGAYNYSDLNRVERAVSELSRIYDLNLVTKTDWRMWDVPTRSDMERYLYNISEIKRICKISVNLPSSMTGLTYSGANDIEKILLAGDEAAQSAYRFGELYCGEV